MNRFRHKTSSIKETSDKHFISDSELFAVRNLHDSRTQTTELLNQGSIEYAGNDIGDVVLKPKSLVNILQRKPNRYKLNVGFRTDGTHNTDADYTLKTTMDELSVKFGTIDKGFSWMYFFIGDHMLGHYLKPNTKYTFFVDMYFSKEYNYRILSIIQLGNATGNITDSKYVENLKVGWNRLRIVLNTHPSINYDQREGRAIYLNMNAALVSEMEIKLKNAMLIEGEIPLSEYPGYFEGVTSVLDEPTTITSHGNNYIDLTKVATSNAKILDIDASKGEFKVRKTNMNNGSFIQLGTVCVDPYTDYTISYDVTCDGAPSNLQTYIYNENSDYYDDTPLYKSHQPIFNTGFSHRVKIGIYLDQNDTNTYCIKNIRMTKGTVKKPFELYNGNSINLDSLSLKKLYDISDKIEGNKIIRYVGKKVLTGAGDEGWRFINNASEPSNSSTIGFCCYTDGLISNIKNNTRYLCDRFNFYKGRNCMYHTSADDFEHIGIWTVGGSINLRIARNKGISTIESFRYWLKSNPITIYYELENPVVEYINPVKLPLYDAQTYVETDASFFIPMGIESTHDVKTNVNHIKSEVINESNRISNLKSTQALIINNLI